MSIQIIKPCPCGGESYDVCCGRFISGNNIPETPEQLMRSRYSAYVLGEEDYLRASWDPATCPPEPLVEPNISWVGLEVRSAQQESWALVKIFGAHDSGILWISGQIGFANNRWHTNAWRACQ
jgi:uncharacterized protein YchJ